MPERSLTIATAVLCALALAACGSSSTTSSGTGIGSGTASGSSATTANAGSSTGTSSTAATQPTIGFEGVPLETGPLLGPAGPTSGAKVDGISCGATEQLLYHIHIHLAVFKDGLLYTLPAGVGIPGSSVEQTQYGPVATGGHCYYWLHTHTTDGVIHVESPDKRIYSLGNFFDVWHQALTDTRVAGLTGKITAFVNGTPWTKSPRAIPLLPHADVQLEIGEPIPPLVQINRSKTQL
jgi:hypothetical protein